jgi:beta-galactosidase
MTICFEAHLKRNIFIRFAPHGFSFPNRFRFRAICTLLLMLLVVFTTSAAENAHRTRLDYGWEFHKGTLGSIWEIWRGDKASDNVRWTSVTLPHCFNARDAVDPDEHYYQGPGWYRVRLKIANPFPGGRTLLHFQGAGQNSKVFVGLEQVGTHVGGYDEWDVDITDAANRALTNTFSKGMTPIAVLCDNSRDAETIPSDLSDFTRYGGLYRHVSLVYVPAISLERVHIQPVLDTGEGKATVKILSRFYNPADAKDEIKLGIRVTDPNGNTIYINTNSISPRCEMEAVAAFEIPDPQLWSPKTPSLYTCEITLQSPFGGQTLTEHFGVRSFEWVDHGPFKLNGKRLLLRGTQYHQDHAGVGAAVPDDVTRRTFQQIKDMGANFVRLAHYQQSQEVLGLCDQLGLLVWEEIPWCRGGLGGEQYKQECRDMLRNMIDQHFNHPSVILWGLGNENGWPGDFQVFDKNAIRSFMGELNALAHQLDPSRRTCIRNCDFCDDIPDVYSPSIWAGWYSGRYTEYRGALQKWIQSVPHFFHAEWGGDSLAGRFSEEPEKFLRSVATGHGTAEVGNAYKQTGGRARASKDSDWSESYICDLFDWYLKEQEQMTNLTGTAQWIFKDFATPLRPENPIPRVNQKGLVERDGTPKEGYYVFQSYWAEKPMVHIFGHSWLVRWGKPDEEKLVKVFSNCGEVELFVNGISVGIRKRDIADFPAAGLHWKVKLNEGTNSIRAVGHRGEVEVTDEIHPAYQTETWSKPAGMTLREIGQSNDVATIEARVFDKNGVACLDAANTIRFGLVGDAQLLDDLGTAGGSRVVQLSNGRARISLRFHGEKAIADVASEGLTTQFLELTNQSPSNENGPLDVAAIDRKRILKAADAALQLQPIAITQFRAKLSEGGPNDFYSNADYFWPDPTKPDGLPYINRDGESNPDNFWQHRMAMRNLRDAVAALAAAYKISGEDRYVAKAVELLRVFFLDSKTRMNPNLRYAQAIPGKTPGRSWGIIDGLHLIEIPPAIDAMKGSPAFPPEILAGLEKWFGEMTDWMLTSKNGKTEAAAKNNHSVAFWLQIASFSHFTGDKERLAECRRQFKEVFVPNQMALDGSFPLELKRTKPYGYSIFQLDNMATLCQVLSSPGNDLWKFELPDGRGIRKAMEFLYPFLADKSKWPLKPDVQAWRSWPAREPSLLFTGLEFGEPKYLALWKKLPADPSDPEVRRNIAITQPILWIPQEPRTILKKALDGNSPKPFKIVAYVPNWINLESFSKTINYAGLTHINIAFENPTNNEGELSFIPKDVALIAKAHANHVKVLVSIGGGSASTDKPMMKRYFDLLDKSKRAGFVAKLAAYISSHDFDGLDVDIEGPSINKDYGAFIHDLADALKPKGKLLTAAISKGYGGNQVPDSVFDELDFANIMAYDGTGYWNPDSPGQHSSMAFAKDSVSYWLARGLPKSKAVLGVPFYGYGFGEAFRKRDYPYSRIIADFPGAENKDQAGNTIWYNGIPTIKAKAQFVVNQGLGGVMIWSLDYDAKGKQSLLSAIDETLSGDSADVVKPEFKVVAFYTGKNDRAHVSFVHEANRWFSKIAKQYHFTYIATTNWSDLNSGFLSNFQVVLFLDTRPENPDERAAFRKYMENGGAWMGFHFAGFALTPSAYPQNWDWYHNEFLGSGEYVSNTWRPTSATLRVEDRKHPATKNLPATFKSSPNEWYRWSHDLRTNRDIDILLSIDPSSFPLGTGPKTNEIWHSGYYPVAWTNKRYKMIYVNMGHNDMDYGKTGKELSFTFENKIQDRLIIDALLWLGNFSKINVGH